MTSEGPPIQDRDVEQVLAYARNLGIGLRRGAAVALLQVEQTPWSACALLEALARAQRRRT